MSISLLALKLQDLRTEHNYTQKYVGSYLNMTRSGYGQYERGKRTPDNTTLLKIAELYGISLNELIYAEIMSFSESGAYKLEGNEQKSTLVSDNLELLAHMLIHSKPKIDFSTIRQTDINFLAEFKQLKPDFQEDLLEYMNMKSKQQNRSKKRN